MAAFTLAWAAITIFVLKVISGPPKLDMAAVRALCISRSALMARLTEDAGWMMLWRPENIETTRNTEPENDIRMTSTGMILIISAAVVAILLIIWGFVTNNNLIAKRNRVKQCRSGICVVLKQRNDLIPNLVASVKAYMGHENEILTRITDLRTRTTSASEREQIREGGEISTLLGRLNVAVENYPELKANTQFLHLQGQIEEVENELQAIRRTYNAAVTDYNNAIEMFPSSIIASWGHHTQEELIEIPESEKQPVSVAELFRS